MMIRFLFLIFILLLCNNVFSQQVSPVTINALELLQSGNMQSAYSELKKSADQKDLSAQFFLAICYKDGLFVEQNGDEAFRLFRITAERGLPDGMYYLAICHEQGVGTPVNKQKAEEWYKRYVNKGGKLLLPDFASLYNEAPQLPLNRDQLYAQQNNTTGSNNQVVNNITIVQTAPTQTTQNPHSIVATSQLTQPRSDVDLNIPTNSADNENTFAIVIANENYQDIAKVPNALNDGEMFAEYCRKALGLPESNVHLVKDATLNNMKREINWMKQTAEAYKGAAKIIVYYAGHGIPDEATKNAFLLPVDGFGTDVSTGYSLSELYATLGKLPAEQVLVLLDACFSGTQRGEGMLASARGVAIKAKPTTPTGQMVVLSAAQGDETAYPYNEQNHGLFTYYLLKKLQETKGSVSLGELSSYVKDEVSKKSIVVNGKSQTPSISASAAVGDSWKNWTLK